MTPDVASSLAQSNTVPSAAALEQLYADAIALAQAGAFVEAERCYHSIPLTAPEPLRALVQNDLAVLATLRGAESEAEQFWDRALAIDPQCSVALLNVEQRASSPFMEERPTAPRPSCVSRRQPRIAILSLLFNWPSSGGGNTHTIELSQALTTAGYDVRHLFARYEPWSIGRITDSCPIHSEVVQFDPASWTLPLIQQRFRQAVETIAPDFVLITDSWNLKPYLAEAVQDFRYLLRFDALECMCPLNNLRQLPHSPAEIRTCTRHRLATPRTCASCVDELGLRSSRLHQVERALSDFSSESYHDLLQRILSRAMAVLVVNPLIAAQLESYAPTVRVVTPGVNLNRFPQPISPTINRANGDKKTLLFAGRAIDPVKGFHVLREAASQLWKTRQDFIVVVTSKPIGPSQPFLKFRDWTAYDEMPKLLAESTLLVAPATAPEPFGLTAIEGMAAGRPVIASRIGGLQFSVLDHVTGLLFEPGSATDLAAKLNILLDSPEQCRQLGEAGRRHVQENFDWPAIVARHYDSLFHPVLV